MPQTNAVVLPGVLPVQDVRKDSPQGENPRLEALASLAVRMGVQDEFLTIPSKVVFRFMDDFVTPVREWCRAQAGKISACFISVFEDLPTVFVVGSGEGYDYTLSGPLANLERDLHYRGWSCSVLQLPSGNPGVLGAFINREKAVQVLLESPDTTHAHS
jgi:hypothetical protein